MTGVHKSTLWQQTPNLYRFPVPLLIDGSLSSKQFPALILAFLSSTRVPDPEFNIGREELYHYFPDSIGSHIQPDEAKLSHED